MSAPQTTTAPLFLTRETPDTVRRKWARILLQHWRRRRTGAPRGYALQGAARLAAGLPTHQRAGL